MPPSDRHFRPSCSHFDGWPCHVQVSSAGSLNASTSFLLKANPLTWTPSKKRTELHHALCGLLTAVLVPLVAVRGRWPPRHVDEALRLWHEAVLKLRTQLSGWVDKHSKHIMVGYPLVTVLLCVGDPALFTTQLAPYLEALFKVLKVRASLAPHPGASSGDA